MGDSKKVFIGWDPREEVAYTVCKSSLERRSSITLSITPLVQSSLRESGIYSRPIDPLASTEFTFSRFFVPYLSNFSGCALFCDCDFLFLSDVKELFSLFDPNFAVQVVQHDYRPINKLKMDGKLQQVYPRKNWSSLILWNCSHPKNRLLGLELLNSASPSFLHRFQWLDDTEIGSIDYRWNWLVGWHKKEVAYPKAVHFTEGGPWFTGYESVDFSDEWREELSIVKDNR